MTQFSNPLNVILSHDWLTGMRGGERVLELIGEQFPDAPIYTLVCNRKVVSPKINAHPIVTSWLQRIPGVYTKYRYFLPLFPLAEASFRPPAADLLISTSHCVAKSLPIKSGTKHLCYCFTPMRYAWFFREEYFGKHRLKRSALWPFMEALQRWDKKSAQNVDHFVAISEHVRKRIWSCYGREAAVVYPPVDTGWFTPGNDKPGDYDLIVSALVPYKKIDLAVRAYNKMGYPLKVVGTGTEYAKLKAMSSANIEWLGWQSDTVTRDLYRRCRCLVFPGEEDFGIVPVEAQACGRPVVAFGRGGALETVKDGVSGIFFYEQSEEALIAAVKMCAAKDWDSQAIRALAERFDITAFLDKMAVQIQRTLLL